MKKKILISIVLALFLLGTVTGAVLGITMFYQKVAGLGKWVFTNEVVIEEIEPEVQDSQVKVKLLPNLNTQADHSYTVRLYLDDSLSGSSPVSWTAAEITASVKKTLIFSVSGLESVIVIEVEVIP